MDNKTLPAINLAEIYPRKEMIIPVADSISDLATEGGMNPLDILVRMKFLSSVSEAVRDKLTPMAITEVEKFHGKTTMLDASIEKAETGVTYDYSSDQEWVLISGELDTVKKRLKARETFLKTIKEPMEVVDKKTGEIILIYPPIKSSTSNIKITLGS